MEKNLKKNIIYIYIYIYIYLNHSAIHLKLTQRCKSTVYHEKFLKKYHIAVLTIVIML